MNSLKKKALITAIVLGTLTSLTTFTACGSENFIDERGNSKNTFNYVVIEENGEHVLHQIETWRLSTVESAKITTKCCQNYIWSSAHNVVFYRNKPNEKAYDYECSCEHE